MGNSYDNDSQDQQQSNSGILALFGFITFWSMAGGHGAEPAVRPRPSPGGEIKPPPLDPPGRLPVRRKGPALGDISDALWEYTTGPVRDLLSRWGLPTFRRRAPAPVTSILSPAQQQHVLDTPGGNDEVERLGWEDARITQDDTGRLLGAGRGAAGYVDGIGGAGESMLPRQSADSEPVLADLPRAASPEASRIEPALANLAEQNPFLKKVPPHQWPHYVEGMPPELQERLAEMELAI